MDSNPVMLVLMCLILHYCFRCLVRGRGTKSGCDGDEDEVTKRVANAVGVEV